MLFLLLLNGCIYLLYSITYNNHLNSEKSRTASEQYAVSVALGRDLTVMQGNERLTQETVYQLMSAYGSYYGSDEVYLRLFHQGEPVFASDELEIEITKPEQSYTFTEDTGDGIVVCASGPVQNFEEYSLIYIRDITEMEETWDNLLRLVFWISLGVSLVLALLLYFIVSRLTRPVSRLAEAADLVAAGDYSL